MEFHFHRWPFNRRWHVPHLQSPEIFLNNARFEKLYFSKNFQSNLVLKVVDEAHLIYSWGLVMSGKMKNLRCHKKTQDRTPFRPSYGNLVERFLATESVPTLLMSATCPPQDYQQILSSLRITEHSINTHTGELVRPEIRFIRVPIKGGGKAWNLLKTFFPHNALITNADLPPTLVYCHTQNDTLLALQAINSARGKPDDSPNGLSACVRRFHATTCPLDKIQRCKDFVDGRFPIMTCTNALGLGQNWSRVRRVIILGEVDPLEVLQMAGRGGRDGRPAVAFLLVNPLSSELQVELNQLPDISEQNDDHRMHAMMVTTVCLRVAFAILLKCVLACLLLLC